MNFFQQLYGEICRDWGLEQSAEFGSSSHMAEVWERLKSCGAFTCKGTGVKMSRWNSLWVAAESFLANWHARLFVLYHIGMRHKWWPSLESSPLGAAFSLPDPGVEPVPEDHRGRADAEQAGIVGGEPRSVKESNRAIREWRASTKNTLHMVAEIMSNQFTLRLARCLCAAVDPSREALSVWQAAMDEHRGVSLELLPLWALEGYDAVASSIWEKLVDPAVLRRCGFTLRASAVPAAEQPLVRAEDQEVAFRYWLYCRVLSVARAALAVVAWRPQGPHHTTHAHVLSLKALRTQRALQHVRSRVCRLHEGSQAKV
jgi:hypothetical protein